VVHRTAATAKLSTGGAPDRRGDGRIRHGGGTPVASGRRERKEDEMSQGAFVTLVGYVAQEPNIRTTRTGKTVTDLRVGITPRYRDQATGEWRDAESSYFTVSCWDRLAHHVRASMHKGEPVLIRGKFKTSTYEDK